MANQLLMIIVYVAIVACGPVLAAIYKVSSEYGYLVDIGRSFALMGFTILSLQIILIGRFKPVERPFGLDILARFHRNMAILALVFLASHPLLLALGSGNFSLLYSLAQPWYTVEASMNLSHSTCVPASIASCR